MNESSTTDSDARQVTDLLVEQAAILKRTQITAVIDDSIVEMLRLYGLRQGHG